MKTEDMRQDGLSGRRELVKWASLQEPVLHSEDCGFPFSGGQTDEEVQGSGEPWMMQDGKRFQVDLPAAMVRV